jgi:hypothetical protein
MKKFNRIKKVKTKMFIRNRPRDVIKVKRLFTEVCNGRKLM